ncbi:zinc-binding alcohol dehydrogenase family protein [Paraburkholderia fynbosensis]|uniref:L-galactonate-5-dehydrogenase n=1 Tax=Paraburkholderia fynbosensis TaxID=1200993 RepID=A0A6J5H379_9BURK|nr:zinc-binding alcohol dehydrogenase family protein [Paraburkholderia fynbosensis]CAB3809745.1 L-galactonate-5-dehydrogenase [Paraburkholderia fynbosensis]
MRTILCDTPNSLQIIERAIPSRAEDEVLIRVRRVGVCGTDLHIFKGDQPYLSYPHVMGHELSGTVEEAPAGSALSKGESVYVMPYMSCGTCRACKQGKTNCCYNIKVLGVHKDGGMADYIVVPQQYVKSAEGVSLDDAAMIEFLAIGAHAVRRSNAQPGSRVLVVGAGPIGMAAAIFATLRNAEVTILDTRESRLNFASQHLGVNHIVVAGEGDEARLSELTNGEFFDFVFDATGNPAAMTRGFRFVAHGGTYVLVSVVSSDITFSDPEFHKRETTLLGSRNATEEDFDLVVENIRAGKIPTAAMATHRLAFNEVPARFGELLDVSNPVVKALIEVA